KVEFRFKSGDQRSSSGSHYTPDELVQPLIKHSLDYIIEDKLKESNPEEGLLSITVCDVACGSGHFLLGAARRIATELAKVRTGEDQPSPSSFREAIRDVIHNCIYGVDLNPLAVELAKVALWLEAHNPGEPLHFLDHKIKCGDAIVGLAHLHELKNGIANEAFKKLPGDDITARTLAKRNKDEKKQKQVGFDFDKQVVNKIEEVNTAFNNFDKLPENTPKEIEVKQNAYKNLNDSNDRLKLKTLADIQTAQFFIPKTINHRDQLVTESTFKDMLAGTKSLIGIRSVVKAKEVASEKRFFHWFLEFPEVFASGGFNCIIGNPPFLGGQKISGSYGYDYLNHLTGYYSPAKSVDLVAFFFRRIFQLIKEYGFQALIATNTIAQGKSREGGLAIIQQNGGCINFAIRSMRWPGLAAVEISQVGVHKGEWNKEYVLDNKIVERITSYLDDSEELGNPHKLHQNKDKSFQGSIVLGKGFVLEPREAQKLISQNPKNKNVLFPYLNGRDLNSNPDQSPSRWVINFFDWDEDKCKSDFPEVYLIALNKIKPQRNRLITEKIEKGVSLGVHDRRASEEWWIYLWPRPELYRTIAPLKRVLVVAQVSKTLAFTFTTKDKVLDAKLIVFANESFNKMSILQSNLHYHWAWKYCTTMKSDLCYTPRTIFETFPFPQNLYQESEFNLDQIGKTYDEYRRKLMLKIQLGFTKTYN
ncbi:MAG: N-6 DNA methylase, partial [Chloroflexi bacterium]|nr:N-6 DNA methylase [Chloroflexota bacterium]